MQLAPGCQLWNADPELSGTDLDHTDRSDALAHAVRLTRRKWDITIGANSRHGAPWEKQRTLWRSP